MGLLNKEKKIDSPTDTQSKNPAADFLMMISVIITTPLVFLYSLLTGRIRNPLVIVGFLCAIVYGFYYLSTSGNISKRDIKTKIIQQTLEELTAEEKEELRKEVSTIRESMDIKIIPEALHPLLDVPIDMLNINYLFFMIQSDYIQPSGVGAEFILDSYLHSNHKMLREKAWESLQNIKTVEADRVLKNYEAEVTQKNEELKKKYGGVKPSDSGVIEDIKYDLENKFKNFRINKGF